MSRSWVSTRTRSFLLGSAATFIVVLPLALAFRASAADSTKAQAMVYSGYLETTEGAPIKTEVVVALNVWDSEASGRRVCNVPAQTITPEGGFFQLRLPESCSTAVSENGNLWLEPVVNSASLGRSSFAIVPYAIEANHAQSADSATPSGELARQLSAIQTDLERLKQEREQPPAPIQSRAFDDRVVVETQEWTWLSGSDSATLPPGRYWVFNTARVWAAAGDCTDCLRSAIAYLAACVKVGDQLTPGASVVAEAPKDAPVSLPVAAIDSFDLTKETTVQFGLCGKRESSSGFSPIVANIFSTVMAQPH